MSTVNLMLLGVLIQKPMNAYEIKREMEARNIQRWIHISSPSVYKNLIKLHTMGVYRRRNGTDREMPEKTVYTINEKGKKQFFRLMKQYSEDPGRIYLDFCAVIANFGEVPPEMGREMLGSLRNTFLVMKKNIEQWQEYAKKESPYALAIVDLYIRIYGLLSSWIEEFASVYEKQAEER